MADNVYLIRRNQQWAKYSNVEEVRLSGAEQSFCSDLTGVAATDVITASGSAASDGQQIVFSSLTGGAGLSTGITYYILDASGTTFKVSATRGGAAVNFTTNITDGTAIILTDELRVWSGEFRDQFASTQYDSTGWDHIYVSENGVADPGGYDTNGISKQSDEVRHIPLRQTLLSKTHWVFDRGEDIAPRYLYATWQDGDIIADNPPETNETDA